MNDYFTTFLTAATTFSREAEFLEQCACRSGCTEGFHGNCRAVEADVFAPSRSPEAASTATRARTGFREDLFFIGFVLLFKEFQAGHADDADVDTFFSQFVFGVDGQFDFRTTGHDDGIGNGFLGIGDDVSPFQGFFAAAGELRQVLTSQDEEPSASSGW